MSTSDRDRPHKYAFEQRVEVHNESDKHYPPVVEVAAKLPGRCAEHNAPYYGCVHGDGHYTFCEEVLKPLSPTNRSKMN